MGHGDSGVLRWEETSPVRLSLSGNPPIKPVARLRAPAALTDFGC
jgi:hypothetical protein